MSDHTYFMQCLHENVGYNQPTHVGGYYLGTGMDFSQVPLETGIKTVDASSAHQSADTRIYDLSGRQVKSPRTGIYMRDGKKFLVK